MTLPLKQSYPPMEAKSVAQLPTGADWQYEPKWDGFRCLAFRDGDQIDLQSKSGQPLGRYFPELVEALLKLKSKQFVLDGEIVVPVDGRPSFDDLLLRMHPAESRVRKLAMETPAHYFAFDLLVNKDKVIKDQPIEKRRKQLEKFFESVPEDSLLKLSPATTDRKVAKEWFTKYSRLGLD